MKWLRLFGKILLLIIIVFVLAVAAWVTWERTRDPLDALPGISSATTLIWSETIRDSDIAGVERYYQDVELVSDREDTIRMSISFPLNYKKKKLPVVTVLGGQEIGKKNFRLIPDPGENILIIYEYPYSLSRWDKPSPGAIIRTRNAILSVPAQVLDLISWARQQEWADTQKMPVLGYSFGAMFQPALHHLATENEIPLHTGVLAYGGADLELLLNENLKLKPGFLRPPVAWLVATLVYSIDPKHHAPHMIGDFYLINGVNDEQIPPESWQQLHRLVPEPKKIDLLDEGHMAPGKPELTLKLVRLSKEWLISKNMLNP